MELITELLQQLTPYGAYAYVLMFLILLACGFGLPLPEDVVLVTGGILAAHDVVGFWETIAVTMAGVLIGDSIIFGLGAKFGRRAKNSPFFSRILTPQRDAKILAWYKKYGDKIIFFARFAPGLRMPLFLSAGIFHVKFTKFLTLDGFAAIISVPVWVYVGELFGDNMEVLEQKIRSLQHGMYALLGGLLLILLAIWYIKRRIRTAL